MGDSLLAPSNPLTFGDIESLWTGAGGSPSWAPTYAGIAEEESSGQASILNDTPATGDYSVGLWQINYYGNLAPGRTAEYGTPSSLAASPSAQAKAAVSLASGGPNLQPWTADAVADEAMRQGPLSVAQVESIIGAGKASGAVDPSQLPATSGATGAGAGATLASLNANPFDLFGIPQTAASSIWSAVGPFLAKATLVIGGIGLVILGLYKATDAGKAVQEVAKAAPVAAEAA